MNAQDLAYWLQGYFELSETAHLDNKQREIISRHCDLVFTTDPTNFFAKTVKQLVNGQIGGPMIKQVVSNYFEHVIDPKHPNPQAAQAAHDGPIKPWQLERPPSNVLLRC